MKRARARGLVLLVGIGALSLQACVYFQGQTERYDPPGITSEAAPLSGERLYQRDCAWCHGDQGGGTSRAPDVVTGTNGAAFTHFMLTTGRMPIDFPTQVVRRSPPAYDEEEIDAIVAHVDSLGATGPSIPDVDEAAAEIGVGAELYQENCAACHSTTAVGGALAPGTARDISGEVARRTGLVAPSLEESSATEIAEAMLVGPGTMPVFASETFTLDEADSIVAYVRYLQHPIDRGGAPIGRIGPVAEGAVGWIVGLGALLLVARFIGTKTEQE
jgi:ubiquinol-cytochrome c reductase cytochrome c subunit